MKRFFKISGIVVGSIVLLLLIAVGYIHLAGIPSYTVKAPDLQIHGDSAMIAEGARIGGVLCGNCHMSANGLMEGQRMVDIPKMFGKIWTPNITHHPNSKLAGYTDGELAYLLRTGVKRDGKYAPPYMIKLPLMSDEDLFSIIAWVRSDAKEFQPSDVVQPKPKPSLLVKFLSRVAFKPFPYPEQTVVAPSPDNKVAYGQYVANARFGCFGCHSGDFTKVDDLHPEKSFGFYGGGTEVLDLEGNSVYTANLTMDPETGLGSWTEEQFVTTVRRGLRPDGISLRYPMIALPAITEEECSAIWAYLQTVPVIKNEVDRQW